MNSEQSYALRTIPFRKLSLLWLGWAILILGFQQVVTARFQPQRPDRVLMWTATETGSTSQNDKIYLIEPFLNEHVSWDSEFYLSIAIAGYDDEKVRHVTRDDGDYALNYAFFPLYPMVIRIISAPLSLLGLNEIATATLVGVIISLAATFAAVVALYDLAQDKLGTEGAFRAVFYFLVFPTAFFLAQVYTEALFAALAFGSLAVMGRSNGEPEAASGRTPHLLLAALLAALATLTRAVGIALALALIAQLLADEFKRQPFTRHSLPWRVIGRGLLFALLPVAAYLLWANSWLGEGFRFVQTHHFGRGTLAILPSLYGWGVAAVSLWQETAWTGVYEQTAVYYALEILAALLALVACLKIRRQFTAVFTFSILAWIITVFSGMPQSNIRYMLVIPAVFLFLAQLGEHSLFDRIWTTASVLLLALLTILFSFDFWVA